MTGLILERGYVVTMDPARRVFGDGAVGIVDGRISAIGPTAEVSRRLPEAERVDLDGALVIPGMVDLHHHPISPAFWGGGASLGTFPSVKGEGGVWSDGGDIDALLRWSIEPYGAPLTEDEAYLSALVAYAALLRSGVTSVVDGGTAYLEAVARAAADIGIRATLVHQTHDLAPGDGGSLGRVRDADELLAATEASVARWARRGEERIRVAAGLWWPIGCSDELCEGTRELAERAGIPVLTHVAALANEVSRSREQHGRTPFDRLDDLGLLGPRLVCAHAGFPTDGELDRIAATQTRIAHVPATSTFGLHGIVSTGVMPRYLERGVVVGLGSDGTRPRVTEYTLAAAASFHKDVSRRGSTMDAPKVLEMATIDGARAAGCEAIAGSLEVGKRADIAVFDRGGIEWQPDAEPVRAFVEGAGAGNVRHVIVDGRPVIWDGILTTTDERELIGRLRSLASDLESRT